MNNDLTIIKLGGALLTDKRKPYTLLPELLKQAALEIRDCFDRGLLDKLILVHGVGSFGHPPVIQYQLHKGFQNREQLIHMTSAQNSVIQLRLAIAQALHGAGVAVSTMLPSSSMIAANGVVTNSFLRPIADFLDLGMVPVVGGDMLVDEQMGFCVYGGDKIAVLLAEQFGASRLVFATDVDGIYERDPKQFPEAKRITRYALQTGETGSAQLDAHKGRDASGAMGGKLAAVQSVSNLLLAGLRVHIISMKQRENLSTLLQGNEQIGTQIVPDEEITNA